MNKDKIRMLVALHPQLVEDEYSQSIIDILTAPRWYHPIKRYKFNKDFGYRIRVVMAEYAQTLIAELK